MSPPDTPPAAPPRPAKGVWAVAAQHTGRQFEASFMRRGPGDKVAFTMRGDGTVVMRPKTRHLAALAG